MGRIVTASLDRLGAGILVKQLITFLTEMFSDPKFLFPIPLPGQLCPAVAPTHPLQAQPSSRHNPKLDVPKCCIQKKKLEATSTINSPMKTYLTLPHPFWPYGKPMQKESLYHWPATHIPSRSRSRPHWPYRSWALEKKGHGSRTGQPAHGSYKRWKVFMQYSRGLVFHHPTAHSFMEIDSFTFHLFIYGILFIYVYISHVVQITCVQSLAHLKAHP